MILNETYNLPVAAPEFSDANVALAAFRTFRNVPYLQKSDLAAFMATPSDARTEFEAMFYENNPVVSGRYCRRILTDII